MLSALQTKIQAYAVPHLWFSFFDFFVAIFGYTASLLVVYYSLQSGQWLLYIIGSILFGLFAVKIFTIQHDSGHGSFSQSESINTWVGRFASLFTTMPFEAWRHEHNIHHGHVADIEKCDHGDILLLSVEAYEALSTRNKLFYRIFRHPLFVLLVAPFLYFFIKSKYPAVWEKKDILSVVLTNIVLIVVYIGAMYIVGFWTVVLVLAPGVYFGGVMGLALFYLQHDYPDVRWFLSDEWEHEHAALEGSSLLRLPVPLEWFTHNIGYHHIHHLDSKVPGYRLRECFAGVSEVREAQPLAWRDVRKAFQLKLWSQKEGRMITFKDLAATAA